MVDCKQGVSFPEFAKPRHSAVQTLDETAGIVMTRMIPEGVVAK
jgi:hypothetical protein